MLVKPMVESIPWDHHNESFIVKYKDSKNTFLFQTRPFNWTLALSYMNVLRPLYQLGLAGRKIGEKEPIIPNSLYTTNPMAAENWSVKMLIFMSPRHNLESYTYGLSASECKFSKEQDLSYFNHCISLIWLQQKFSANFYVAQTQPQILYPWIVSK